MRDKKILNNVPRNGHGDGGSKGKGNLTGIPGTSLAGMGIALLAGLAILTGCEPGKHADVDGANHAKPMAASQGSDDAGEKMAAMDAAKAAKAAGPTPEDFAKSRNTFKDGTKILLPPLRDLPGDPGGRLNRIEDGTFQFVGENGVKPFADGVKIYAARRVGDGLYALDLGDEEGLALVNSKGVVVAKNLLYIGDANEKDEHLVSKCGTCGLDSRENLGTDDISYRWIDKDGKPLADLQIETMRSAGDSKGSILASDGSKSVILDSAYNRIFTHNGLLFGLGKDRFLVVDEDKVGIFDTAVRKFHESTPMDGHVRKIAMPDGNWYFDWKSFVALKDSPNGGFEAPELVDNSDIHRYDSLDSRGPWWHARFRSVFSKALENAKFRELVHWGSGESKRIAGSWPETLETHFAPLAVHFKDTGMWYVRFTIFEDSLEEMGYESVFEHNPLEIPTTSKPYVLLDGEFKPVFEEGFDDIEFPGITPELAFMDGGAPSYWDERARTPKSFYGKKDGKWATYSLDGAKIAEGKGEFTPTPDNLHECQSGETGCDDWTPWFKRYGYDKIKSRYQYREEGLDPRKMDMYTSQAPNFLIYFIDKHGRRTGRIFRGT